jgi:hypothetical protein
VRVKLPSEKADHLIPFLRKIKEQYDDPIAIVSDMGKGIASAVGEVFPNVQVFICHSHFLRDLGKDLMEEDYGKIRNKLKADKIRTTLGKMKKQLEIRINGKEDLVDEVFKSIVNGNLESECLERVPGFIVYGLIRWISEPTKVQGYGFPFDRKHLEFYRKLKVVSLTLNKIVGVYLRNNIKGNEPLYKLRRVIKQVIDNKSCAKTVVDLEEKVAVFDKFREALRINLIGGKMGLNDQGDETDIKTIEGAVESFKEWLLANPKLSKKLEYKKMIKQIDHYWNKLFADPITVMTPSGPIEIQPQRTNNLLEQFFRSIKRLFRKRTGTSDLNKTLKAILADTPLVRNLENAEYLKIILNGCSTLEERFAQIDAKMVIEERKAAEKTPEKFSSTTKKIIKLPQLPQKIAAAILAHAS